jgi:hypothetical protein
MVTRATEWPPFQPPSYKSTHPTKPNVPLVHSSVQTFHFIKVHILLGQANRWFTRPFRLSFHKSTRPTQPNYTAGLYVLSDFPFINHILHSQMYQEFNLSFQTFHFIKVIILLGQMNYGFTRPFKLSLHKSTHPLRLSTS